MPSSFSANAYQQKLDLTQVEAAFPKWQPFNLGWISRARSGPGAPRAGGAR